jgi:hypothetical protein
MDKFLIDSFSDMMGLEVSMKTLLSVCVQHIIQTDSSANRSEINTTPNLKANFVHSRFT